MRYYRSKSFIGKISEHMGMTTTEVHQELKRYFFKKSTTEFEDSEFDEKLEEIRVYFSRIGLWIPEPNESEEPPQDTTDYSEDQTSNF